ncbi:hypothetical protein OK016_01505 [Vibrio chagasii]|nr:hypothetical protein [Vibrio chagasii]
MVRKQLNSVALEITEEALQQAIDQHFWQPVYVATSVLHSNRA